MADIIKARHVGYTEDGIPIMSELESTRCDTGKVVFPWTRTIDYTTIVGEDRAPYHTPIMAEVNKCCDVTNDTFQEPTCWPFLTGPDGPGIGERILVRVRNVAFCYSSWNKYFYLEWDGSDWVGELELYGGTVAFKFTCIEAEAYDSPVKFKLYWTCNGIEEGAHELFRGFQCLIPLKIIFEEVSLFSCCCGNTIQTDADPQIGLQLEVNCYETVWGRHIGYDAVTGTPIVATVDDCYDTSESSGCDRMRCGLTAAVTDNGGCACMEATTDLPWNGGTGFWEKANVPGCIGENGPYTVNLFCEDLDLQTGLIRLTCGVKCPQDSDFQYDIIEGIINMETLDETFTVAVGDGEEPDCCLGSVNVRITR